MTVNKIKFNDERIPYSVNIERLYLEVGKGVAKNTQRIIVFEF
jgi:hypothetical protein